MNIQVLTEKIMKPEFFGINELIKELDLNF